MATTTQGGFTIGRAITVAIITMIAFVVGAGLVVSKPTEYRANATVPMVATSIAFAAPINVSQQADNYAAELTTDAVVDRVAKQLGRSPSDVRASITNDRISSSNLVVVTCTGRTPKAAVDCVKAISGAAYEDTLAQTSLTEQKIKEVTQAQVKEANDRLTKIVIGNNGIAPDQDAQTTGQTLANLKNQLTTAQQATDAGAPARAASLRRQVAAAQARLLALTPTVQEYRTAFAQLTNAVQNLSTLTNQQRLLTALEQGNEALIRTSEAAKVAKLNTAVRTGVATGVVALVLVVGLFILIDVTSKPVSRSTRSGDGESRDPRDPRVGGTDGVRTDAERDYRSSAS